ncbi:hypothetical protein KKI24_08880 [bacterium]|nr:hypothetical protein [bacterium]
MKNNLLQNLFFISCLTILLGCSELKKKEGQENWLHSKHSDLISENSKLKTSNNQRLSKLRGQFGGYAFSITELKKEIDTKIDDGKQQILRNIAKLKTMVDQIEQQKTARKNNIDKIKFEIARNNDRKQVITDVSQILDEFTKIKDHLPKIENILMKSHAKFKRKKEELPFCGDELDCNLDLEELVKINQEIIVRCQQEIDEVQLYVSGYHQKLKNVNWVEESDKTKAYSAMENRESQYIRTSITQFEKIKEYHSRWNPEEFKSIIESFN